MVKNNLHKELRMVKINSIDYLCVLVEPIKENGRVRLTHARMFYNSFNDTVDKWVCDCNTGELQTLTIGKDQGYSTRELQEDEIVVIQQKVDFMEVTKKLSMARMQNSQYKTFINKE